MKKINFAALLLIISIFSCQLISFAAPTAEPSAQEETQNSPAPSDSGTDEAAEASPTPDANTFPEPRAKAAMLFDLNGGRIVYESHINDKVYPASLTKIMTALIALEKGNLSDVITVSDTALADINYLHSKIDLKAGEQMTFENLLMAMLVCSANDAANVIAEYIAGDIPTFVDMMNQRAQELGMLGTHYANPHGFHDENHYSTVSDISIVTREALKNSKFCEIVKTKTYTIPATNISKERLISSTNHLISRYRNTYHYYPYATGVKTGSTTEAGSCLVATAEKNGISLLSIVMGCDNQDQKENAYSFTDTTAMFEYIFNNYKSVTIASTSDVVSDSKVYEAKDSTRVALSPSKNVVMLLPSDYTAEELSVQSNLIEEINAPIEKGSVLGNATYSFRGETLATVDLLAANEVKRDNLLHFLHALGRIFFSPYVLIPLLIIIVLLIGNAYIQYKKRKVRRRRMKSQRPTVRKSAYSQNQYSRPRQTRSSSSARRRTPDRSPSGYRDRSYNSSRTDKSYRSTTSRYGSASSRTATRRPRQKPPEDPWDKYR